MCHFEVLKSLAQGILTLTTKKIQSKSPKSD
jgi:hypothetical protein